MDIPVSTQVVISLAGNLLAAALQMIGHKLLGVAVFVFSMGLLWWALLPLMIDKGIIDAQSFPLWVGGGWAALIVIGLLWAWAIVHLAPVTIPGVQTSSTNQSGGVTAHHANIGSITIHPPPEKPKRVEPQTSIPSLPLSTQNDMVVRLRDLIAPSGGRLSVAVEPTTSATHPFARTLTAIFEAAGWEAELRDPPHGYFNPMNRGIGVTGANTHLVITVAEILRTAGCTQVSGVAQQMVRGTPPPGWNQDQHFIRIEISYLR